MGIRPIEVIELDGDTARDIIGLGRHHATEMGQRDDDFHDAPPEAT